MNDVINSCIICGGVKLKHLDVLSQELIDDWNLNDDEVAYTNLQQGFHCEDCKCNLRVMTMAAQMLEFYGSKKTFIKFVKGFKKSILEINQAGMISSFLSKAKNHTLKEYPDIDIENISYPGESFDVIIHSDTLEHIPDSVRGLKECRRVLKTGGVMFFTIPIIHERLTIKRDGMKQSYHGLYSEMRDDLTVVTEYGADFYMELLSAGFKDIRLFTMHDKSSVSIAAVK